MLGLKKGGRVMISPFEASLLGYVTSRPSSRYDIMKGVQNQIIYWAGSPGAVYSAIERLEKKGMLEEVDSPAIKTYQITNFGSEILANFLLTPILAPKLLLDPVQLRVKLRGATHLDPAKQHVFYQQQQVEIEKAIAMVKERRMGNFGQQITQELSDLVIEQLKLEANLLSRLINKTSGAEI